MALNFDGVDDAISAAIAAVSSTEWTFAHWANIETHGEAVGVDPARILDISASNTGQFYGVIDLGSSTVSLRAFQRMSSTHANSQGTVAITKNAWIVAGATYSDADKTIRLYSGAFATPVTEVTSTQTVGIGTRVNDATNPYIGNHNSGVRALDGSLAHLCIYSVVLTAAEWDSFRLGIIPVRGLRNYWAMDNATTARDIIGSAHGSVSGATLVADPSNPIRLEETSFVMNRRRIRYLARG